MKQREILFVVISIFIMVILYIGFSIYHNAITSTVPDALSIQIQPISPTFDENTISQIKQRIQVSSDLNAKIAQATPSATPTPSVIPSPSPEISQTPATSGAQISTSSGGLTQ